MTLQVGQLVESIEGEEGQFEVIRVNDCSATLQALQLVTKSWTVYNRTVRVNGVKRKVPLKTPQVITTTQRSQRIVHVSREAVMRHLQPEPLTT